MMQLSSRSLTFVFLGVLLVLNVGAIRKNEDPIAKTQTDPISYKDKLEETKDGVKGAPTPSFSYYGKEKFLVKTAVEGEGGPAAASTPSGTPAEVSEVEFEEESEDGGEELAAEELSEEDSEEWWVDEAAEGEESPEESLEETDLQGGRH